MIRFIVIADTHGLHSQVEVPDGDVLVHCGDITGRSTVHEIANFLAWFASHPHPAKIMIAGNHDRLFETDPDLATSLIPEEITYLNDSGCEIGGLRIWGSPVQPCFNNWAFNRQRGPEIARHWAMIPDNTDILLTHGPASGILDRTPYGIAVGCADLRQRIESLRLMAHYCGHVHFGHGRSKLGNTVMVNAAICDEAYRPIQEPIIVEI